MQKQEYTVQARPLFFLFCIVDLLFYSLSYKRQVCGLSTALSSRLGVSWRLKMLKSVKTVLKSVVSNVFKPVQTSDWAGWSL